MAAASSAPSQSTLTCPAHSRRTHERCKHRAGFGTDHVGYGFCKYHGGSTTNGRTHAAKLQAAALGAELDIDPHEAILVAVRKAAMWERFCAQKIAALDEGQLVISRSRTVETRGRDTITVDATITTETHVELNVWLREHQQAVRDLAHIAKVALDAGVEERRVRLAEQLADDLAAAFDLLLTRLGVRDHVEAPAAVRAALALVEAPRALEAA